MNTKPLAWGLMALITPLFASAAAVDPTDKDISSPASGSASAYSDYVPDQAIELQSWQAANAAAANEPGHAGHAAAGATDSESMHGGANHANTSEGSGASKTATPPAVDGHAGHGSAATAEPKKEKAPAVRATPAAARAAGNESAKTGTRIADQVAKAKVPSPDAGGRITATGTVLAVDKANGKVKVTHDPIPQIGWPKMTMYFRVKDPALLDRVTEGPAQFVLEKSGSGYVISDFRK